MKYTILYKTYPVFIILFFFLLLSPSLTTAVTQINQTITIEANLLNFGDGDEVPEVGIEVPDYIFLGNISKDEPLSDEKTLKINNTGKTNITITPKVNDEDEEIFTHLYFRTMKSSTVHPELNIPYKIGEYSVSIEKPSSGSTKRSKDIYLRLNLTGFEGNLRENTINYKKEIIIIAMAE